MDENAILGRIEVRPPLNEAERAYLCDLAASTATLRGTPTGRGDSTVPFARLAWEPCPKGCCLTWNGQEWQRHLLPSLRFLVDHLFGPGAKAAGHRRFSAFSCDHVLDGAVAIRDAHGRVWVAEVTANRVGGRSIEAACVLGTVEPRSSGKPRPRPANVIEFRPRRA